MTDQPKRTRKPKAEWHLVCITRNGKVSMLKNLDLFTARETYKKLLPGTHPKRHIWPECNIRSSWGFGRMTIGSSRDDGDGLERVEVVGPEGVELDPWCGVEPRVIDHHEEHSQAIRQGRVECDCTDKLKKVTRFDPMVGCEVLVGYEDFAQPQDDTDDTRLLKLYKEVPTAFWLEPTNNA